MDKYELGILRKFKKYAPIENEEEEGVLEKYSLIGWVQWGIDPDDNYQPYAQLTQKALSFIRVKETLESRVRTFWHKLINSPAL